MDEVVERAERLVDRGCWIEPVELVEVDVVGLQTAQGCVDRVKDVPPGVPGVEGRRPGRFEALRGKDETVPSSQQPATEDLLGATLGCKVAAERIGVRGVDEVDAALRSPIEDRDRGGLVALQSEGHRPKTELRHLKAGPSQSGVIHEPKA